MAEHCNPTELIKSFGITTQTFNRWVRRTITEVNRSGKRLKARPITADDVVAAVVDAKGKDFYTGEPLHWHRIPDFFESRKPQDDIASRRLFWQIPTIDYENPFGPSTHLRLCSRKVAVSKTEQNPIELVKMAAQIKAKLKL
jgi:hypothetical protein